jgi:glucose dehydrogenase
MLANLTIGGQQRRVLMQAPKNGFFYVLDRLTGALLSAEPFVPVTWATGIDKKTGRPIEATAARYGTTGAAVSPASGGANNWQPMSWNPGTGLAYIAGRINTQFFKAAPTFAPQPGRYNTGLAEPEPGRPAPPRPSGFLLAWDPVAQRERWRIPIETPINSGTLTTAGGLVFSGRAPGSFRAHDALTGDALWETQLPPGPAAPITYRLGDRQYVSVLAGRGQDGRVFTFALDEAAR